MDSGFQEFKFADAEGRAYRAQKKGGCPHLHAIAAPQNGELQYGRAHAELSIQIGEKSINENKSTLALRPVVDRRYSNRVNRRPHYGIEAIDPKNKKSFC